MPGLEASGIEGAMKANVMGTTMRGTRCGSWLRGRRHISGSSDAGHKPTVDPAPSEEPLDRPETLPWSGPSRFMGLRRFIARMVATGFLIHGSRSCSATHRRHCCLHTGNMGKTPTDYATIHNRSPSGKPGRQCKRQCLCSMEERSWFKAREDSTRKSEGCGGGAI